MIVLTAGQMNIGSPLAPILEPVPGGRLELQRVLAQLSSRGEQRVIHGSGHLMHLDTPAAIVQAVHDLLTDLSDGAD